MSHHAPKTEEMIAAARAELAERLLQLPDARMVTEAEEAAERSGGRLLYPMPQLGLHLHRYEMLGLTGKGASAFAAIVHWCLEASKAGAAEMSA